MTTNKSDDVLAAIEGCLRVADAAGQPVTYKGLAEIARDVRDALASNPTPESEHVSDPPASGSDLVECAACNGTGQTTGGDCRQCEGVGALTRSQQLTPLPDRPIDASDDGEGTD